MSTLATAQIVDACMRLKLSYRLAPYGIQPIVPIPQMLSGPVIPVRHYGSVDIFMEVLEANSQPGILVIDNQWRFDEACIGDLAVLEFKHAGIQAVVVNGLHRDTTELLQIGLPVFSYGAFPAGPARLDVREPEAMSSARFEHFEVTTNDTAFVDADGVVFLKTADVPVVLPVAQAISDTEKQQANAALSGVSLREQFQFAAFLEQRKTEKEYTFRKHLSTIAKSIEE